MLHVWCQGNSHTTFVSLTWICQIQERWRLEEVRRDLTSSGCSWHGEMEDLLWHPDLPLLPSLGRELACSNGGLSQITPLKLFMPLVFVPSTSENKDASLYSKWNMRNIYFFSSRALQCSLEAPIVLNRLIVLFLAHLGTLMKPRSTWRNSGRKYSNVQSVPLAHISEALPHSNRWTYVSQLSQS